MHFKALTGQTDTHINQDYALHHEVVPHFVKLQKAALEDGHSLQVASGFRSYERQLTLWQEKLEGKRPIMDESGNLALDPQKLSPSELLWSVLKWSALPGLSRHHWGSDFDVYDDKALPSPKLEPHEYEVGPLRPLSQWLEARASDFDFIRPYLNCSFMGHEPWHLSYQPLSHKCQELLDPSSLLEVLKQDLPTLARPLQDHFDEILKRCHEI